MCPYCKEEVKVVKYGSYVRPSDQKVCQRFRCGSCHKTFSETHFGIDYRLRKRSTQQEIFRSLCSGVSQRRCAILFGMHRDAIARRLIRFGACAKHNLELYRKNRPVIDCILLDELESFEHTKCKPLTAPIAVEDKTRKIIALSVGKIPSKGPLAAISRKKYGFRFCERKVCLRKVFEDLKQTLAPVGVIKTDQSKSYPVLIREFLPEWQHKPTKGRRGCVVGQGELKAGGWDPLFSLNHTYAMIRDGLKRLARRTWTTTKIPERLEISLYMYAWFHNLYLDSKKIQAIRLEWTR